MAELNLLKKMFFSKIGENSDRAKGSLNVYENVVINIFINLVYNESLY